MIATLFGGCEKRACTDAEPKQNPTPAPAMYSVLYPQVSIQWIPTQLSGEAYPFTILLLLVFTASEISPSATVSIIDPKMIEYLGYTRNSEYILTHYEYDFAHLPRPPNDELRQ